MRITGADELYSAMTHYNRINTRVYGVLVTKYIK